MNKVKKVIVYLAVLVAIAGIVTGALFGQMFLPSKSVIGFSEQYSVVDRKVPSFSVDGGGDFRVLQFTDTHLMNGSTKNDVSTLNSMKNQLETVKPDLAVVTGDMVDGKNANITYNKKAALEAVGNMFEEVDIYWAYVPGNNDGEFRGSTDDVAAFLSQYEHCIVSNTESITGSTHYTVDINDNGETVHSLVFIDSLARDENNKYDFVKDDQLEWLTNALESKKNDDINCSLFFHMNTPAFLSAVSNGEPYSEGYSPIPEDFTYTIEKNGKLDKVIDDSGCVGLVAIGHVHPDKNWCSFYDGRYYHIAKPSGYRTYEQPSCTLITIHTAETQYRDMYDFQEIMF